MIKKLIFPDNVVGILTFIDDVFGFPFNLWLGHNYHYITKDPQEVKTILHNISAQNKGFTYQDISYVFQNSLLTIHYNKWRLRRKEYAKSFKPASLKPFSLDYYKDSCDFIKEVKRQNGELVIAYDTFTKYAFNSFFSTSIALDKKPTNMHRFGECLMEFQSDVARKLLNPLIPASLWLRFQAGGKIVARKVKELRSISEEILRDKNNQREDFKSFVANEETPALLDLMMSLKGGILSDEDIFDDLMFLSSAATDTSGHLLMFMFTLLGMYPEVQQKIYDEVIQLVGENNILPDDVSMLIYTEAFISESLRLLPVVPASTFISGVYFSGHKIIPKGANVVLSLFHLHRSEKYWEDPQKFDPDRFLPENVSKITPYSYLPFSSGPRDCLGKAQAMVMLKISVGSIVRSFQISSKHKSIDEFELMSSLSLKTKHPLDCHFTPRD
ncbi:hypothetical protein HUJ04_001775 [Dendroctonus ponderosae]|nr:hypothetical protein HUJ04_001775 [Dendroctonus ponderosae]